ncbi:hypothetical protein FWF48_01575 [Candidatus Saccharibacteria bacterium]|nr:hypothetical protein [Candidatus Saccharibacteria bacterium]
MMPRINNPEHQTPTIATTGTAEKLPITSEELLHDAQMPPAGETQFVLLRNPSDHQNRDLKNENYGTLDEGAAEQARQLAYDYFSKALEKLTPDERDKVKVLVFASPSPLTEPGKEPGKNRRAVLGAASEIQGIGSALVEHGAPETNILNWTDGTTSGDQQETIFQPEGLKDLRILTESPDFVDFMIQKARENTKDNPNRNWSQEFWSSYEDDTYAKEREAMKAEGPIDIADRMQWQLAMINNSMQYVFDDEPSARLVVWVVGQYDNISPFIKEKVTGVGFDDFQPMKHNSGIAINVTADGQATTKIHGKAYSFEMPTTK